MKNEKAYFFMLLSALSFMSCSIEYDYEIFYIGLYTSMPINMNCDNFHNLKNNRMMLSSSQKKYFIKKIKSLKISSNTNIDARIRGYIFDEKVEKLDICANSSIIGVNNKYYIVDDSLRSFLEKVTNDPLAKIISDGKNSKIK